MTGITRKGNIMRQLVAIDIDGTLVNSSGEITEKVYESIKKAKSKDVHIALCSGRPNFGLKPIIEKLPQGSIEYVIAHNGAMVQEVQTGKVISASCLQKKDLLIFQKINERLGLHLSFYDFDHLYTLSKEINGGMARNILTQQCMIQVLGDLEDAPEEEILKIQFLEDDPAIIDKLIEEIPKDLYEKYYIVRSVIDNLEVMDKNVNKWFGISKLAKYLGIPGKNVVGIGDEENDREMLENAGLSIVMGNASDKIKELADFVTKTNDEHGVAYALEKIVYQS